MTTHTPGTWTVVGGNDGGMVILAHDAFPGTQEPNRAVASVFATAGPEWAANATLMTAAPELLAACELAMRYLTRLHERPGIRLEGEEEVGNALLRALQRAKR